MSISHGIKKQYSTFRGIDLSVDDITRGQDFATEAQNIRIRENGNLQKRKGYKLQHDAGSYALINFPKTDPTTGQISEELLIIDDNIKRRKVGTLTIQNDCGTGQTLSVTITGNPTTNQFDMVLTLVELLDANGDVQEAEVSNTVSYGDETTTAGTTISSLITTLSALSYVTASTSDTSTVPAASLDFPDELSISDGQTGTIDFYYEETITADSAADLDAGHADFKNNTTGEHLSHAVFNRSLFLANGFDDLLEYDGHTVFKAGMSQHSAPSVAATTGSITGTFLYKVQTIFKNRNSQLRLGAISDASASVSPSTQSVNVTINNIEDGSGYDARGAVVNGNQTATPSGGLVTLTVDSGHTVIADDVVYLLEQGGSTYEEYTVSRVTSTTIIVESSSNIQVNNNDIISTGIRHRIYRTKDGGSTYFFLAEIPNDFTSSTQTFNDDTADSSLETRFVDPARVPGTPPKARYVTSYKNVLVLGHELTDPNKVWHSEPDDPTNFPTLNNFLVESPSGGVISSVKSSNETLVIFKRGPESTFTMTGDLVNRRIRLDILSPSIGCQSHATVQDVNGILFFLSEEGVHTMVGAGIPQLIGRPVNALVTKKFSDSDKQLNLRKAIALRNPTTKEYLIHLPAETLLSTEYYSNNNSRLLVYDYFNDNWTEWTNVNWGAGAQYFDNTLVWCSRQTNIAGTSVESYVFRQHRENKLSDYGDQTSAIPFRYASGWESQESPSIYKKFLRLKIHALQDITDDDDEFDDFTVAVTSEKNFIRNQTHSAFTASFPNRGSTWGSKSWGNFTWGGYQQPSFRTKLRQDKAQSLRLIYSNEEYNKNLIISGWELEIAQPHRRFIKE